MVFGRFLPILTAIATACAAAAATAQTATNAGLPQALSCALILEGSSSNMAAPTSPASGADAMPQAPTNSDNPSLLGDTPWFQRFLLPVPESYGTVDDWLCCKQPGFIGNVDFVNWLARRGGLDYASLVNGTGSTSAVAATQSLDFHRNDGVRAGLGYRFGNGWDVRWNYTYFRTANDESITDNFSGISPNPTLIATQSYLSSGQTVKVPVSAVEAGGSLRINIHDCEVAWTSCLNDTVGFSAFGGVRWAMIDQTFDSNYTYLGGTGSVSLPNNMDAEGIRLGAEFQLRSSSGLRAFGRFAESVLVAGFRTVQHETDPVAGIVIDVSNRTTVIVPVFEASFGFAYSRGPWEVRAGYEMSDWFNMVQVNRDPQSLLLDGYFFSLSFSR